MLTLLLYALMVWFSLSVVLGFEGAVAPWVAATMSALVLAALRQAGVVQGAASSALGSMVRTGEGGPQGPIEEEPKARWLWQAELRRCRPGWMVAAEALGYCAFAASFVLGSLALRPHSRRALWAWWQAEAPLAPWPDDCFNMGIAVMLSVVA